MPNVLSSGITYAGKPGDHKSTQESMYNPNMTLRTIALLLLMCNLVFCHSAKKTTSSEPAEAQWISLFNGKDLTGWNVKGDAQWKVINGVLTGEGGRGHIYADPVTNKF
jgi:hypothetical protein